MIRSRKKEYGSHVSLSSRMHHGKKKWMVRFKVNGKDRQRLFSSYDDALEAYRQLQQESYAELLPKHLQGRNWRQYVDDGDYDAILLWREFRKIYDEVTQQSSLPLQLVVREALKSMQQEIANGAVYGHRDAEGHWVVTPADEERLKRLDELTDLFSMMRFLSNKRKQVSVDFQRKFGLLARQYREVVDKRLEANVIRAAHRNNVTQELQRWLQGWEEVPVNQITPDMIEEKLESFTYRGMPLGNASKKRYRTTLYGFFAWARSRDLVARNPVERTIAPRAIPVAIGIISPEVLKRLLQAAAEYDRGMLFPLSLAAFCGLRRSECVRMSPDAVLSEKGEVFVSAAIAKTGKQRFVPLPEAAAAWLALAEFEPFSSQDDRQYDVGQYGKRLSKLARLAGVKLPRNALRHSFASYAAARTHDVPRVSMWLGHAGTNMTEKHYREGVRQAEGEEWFLVFPDDETTTHSGSGIIETFNK